MRQEQAAISPLLPAAGEQIQFFLVNGAAGLYVEQAEEGVEDVVLRVFAAAGAVWCRQSPSTAPPCRQASESHSTIGTRVCSTGATL